MLLGLGAVVENIQRGIPKGRDLFEAPRAQRRPVPKILAEYVRENVDRDTATITGFVKTLTATAEQLTPIERWCRVLSQVLVKYLHGRQLQPPALLPAPG